MRSHEFRESSRNRRAGSEWLSLALSTLLSRPVGMFVMVLIFSGPVVAQERLAGGEDRERPAPTVTATATAERVRFNSPGAVTQMRLEVFDAAGERLFDSGFLSGNLLDWPVQDQGGERLADGSYLCVATARDLGGRQSRRAAVLTVASGQGKLEPLNVERLTAGQARALEAGRQTLGIGSSDGDESLTVLAESERAALTVAAHDGRDGKVVSTQGALTLGTGNIFSGADVEHVRITEDGRVGIGTAKPEATLDVAGEVKARGGIKFSDGTTLDASGGKLTLKDGAGDTISGPSAAGTGTQNRLAKWAETGGAGTLGDSAITESGGNLGVGITNPAQKLHVVGSFSGTNPLTPDRIGAFVNDGAPANHAILAVIAGSNGVAGIDLGDTQNQNQSYVRFNNGTLGEKLRFGINNADVLTLQSNGNVGIGTPNPIRTLQIGPSADAAFSFSPSTGSPNAGFIRFGDNTGWKLHIGRNRESSSASLNNATLGTLMTIQDNGNIGIGTLNPRLKLDVAGDAVIDGRVGLGTPTPQAKLDVRGSIRLGNSGELFAPGGEENLRIVRGVIGFNGNIIVGSGFTVDSTFGRYTITFNTPFAGPPAVTVTTDFSGETTRFAQTAGVTASEAKIRIFQRSDGDDDNETFHFIAIGPR